MKRTILVLAALFVALFAWERSLTRAAVELRAQRTRVGYVLDEERRANLPVAALRVEIPGESPQLYARVKGRWAVLTYERAAADANALGELLNAVAQAQGTIVSEDPASASEYGLDSSEAIVVSFCGPKVLEPQAGGDVLEAFELGRSLEGRGASFLRRRGSPAIWSIESNPRALLVPRAAPGLPPLLDPAAIPGSWEGWSKGLGNLFVDLADGTSLRLERRVRNPEINPPAQGEPPWEWIVIGAAEHAGAPAPTRGYELFLQRIPYTGVVDAKRAAEFGFDAPTARLTLAPNGAEPLVVLLGPPIGDGRIPLFAPALSRLVLLAPEVARLLTPAEAWFSPSDPQNPWDPYLRESPR